MEQSRLEEAERGAREPQALSSTPATPSTLFVLGNKKRFVSDKYGNVHVSSVAVSPFVRGEQERILRELRDRDGRKLCPESGRPNCSPDTRKENPSSDAPPHSFPPVHLLESNDLNVLDGLEPKSSNNSHASESKDTVVDFAGISSEHLPQSESKSESETELLFEFPAEGGISCGGNPNHSPLLLSWSNEFFVI